MKRTQLYLQNDIWKILHVRARQRRTSISELVRQAVQDKYGNSPADRKTAMQGLVGLWRNRRDLPSTEAYVRRLRRGNRLRRIAG